MSAGSLLDSFRYAQFISEDEPGGSTTEGRQGVPRYNGDAAKLNEWIFRARMMAKKEAGLSESEQKKLGSLSLRLIEGLSGHALKIAQQLDLAKLDQANGKGLDYLIEKITTELRPRRMQQARELYEAGAQQGGILSRQPTEPMGSYVLRRRAWYNAMVDLSSELKLPDLVLSEQLLLNSGLDENQRLMIRTVVGEKMDFDRVAQELVNQHPNIQARASQSHYNHHNYFRKPENKGFSRFGSKGSPKGYRGKPRYQAAFFAEEDEGFAYPDGTNENYSEEIWDGGTEDYATNEPEALGFFSDQNVGTYAEEHLAYLTENGLDPEDQEACEFASDVIQAEQEAYFARKGAATKGHGGFRKGNPPFEISGSISLDDKRARLRALKARTTCKRCGAVGHWSGDFECPMSKGKGKWKSGGKTSTSTTTSGAGNSQHRGGGGRGSKPDRPRTVYFSISEAVTNHPTANLAYRNVATPPRANAAEQDWSVAPSMRAVPPPAMLTEGMMAPSSPTAASSGEQSDNWSVVVMPTEVEGQWLPMDTDDPDMVELYDALAHPNPENALATMEMWKHDLSEKGIRRLPHRHLHRYRQLRHLRWVHRLPLRRRHPEQARRETRHGGYRIHDNTDYDLPALLDNLAWIEWLGEHPLLRRPVPVRKEAIPGIAQTFQELVMRRIQELEAGSEVPAQRLHEALDLAIATTSTWTSTASPSRPGTAATSTLTSSSPGSSQPVRYGNAELHRNLQARGLKVVEMGRYKHGKYCDAYQDRDYRTWVLNNIGANSASGMKALKNYFEERSSYEARTDALALMAMSEDEHTDAIYEHDLIAILDTGCNQTCHGDRWLERYIQATGQSMPEVDQASTVRIRGIGGHIQTAGTRKLPLILELINGGLAQGDLTSTELVNSDAPLLISMQAQRALGLIIDVAGEVVHSQTLGHDLRLAYKDGLLGIRLLPGETDQGARDRDGPPHGPVAAEVIAEVNEEQPGEPENVITEEVSYYTVDLEKSRVMSRAQHVKVKESVDNIKIRDRHMWNQVRPVKNRRNHELPRGCRTFLLEIFAGAAVLTQMAFQEWAMPVSPPVDLNTGYDLLTKEGRDQVDMIIERDDPFAIAFAPVCGPWTSWTNIAMGQARETIMEQRKRWRPTIQWMYKVTKERLAKGRQVLIENPWNSAMWDCKASQSFFRQRPKDEATLEPVECVKIDQCMFGLCDKDNGMPHMKPTGILTASRHVKCRLAVARCDGQHVHQQLDTKRRCVQAQEYPVEMCKQILEGWMDELDYMLTMVAFPAEAHAELEIDSDDDGEEVKHLDGILSINDLADQTTEPSYAEKKKQEEWEVIYQEGEIPPPPAPVGEPLARRQHLWRELPYNTRVALRRLHHMVGHAPPSAMQRLLRTAGADPAAIRALENFRCPTCEEMKKPMRAAPVKMPEEYRFNKAISIDVLVAKDAFNHKYKIMSVVDLGTLFHAAVVVGEGGGPPSSGNMARALSSIWFSWAGPPESVVLDRGLENRGQLQKLLSSHGVLLRYIGVESPYQLGRGERHGGILKEVIKGIVTSRQLRGRQNMEFAVTEAVGIKNHKVNHNGFSPSQWVLGRNPPDLESLTTLFPEARLGVHQEILDGESAFAQQMMIRGAAKEAFAQVDSSQRIRAAMLRKSVPGRGPFTMGDLVCFHRRQGGKAGWKWFGPARVIGQEGKGTLWICHGGIPMTVSSEQCRHATGGEMMAKRILELRPSRKRRREDMSDFEAKDTMEEEEPFTDDLIGLGGSNDHTQPGFFDLHDHMSDYSPWIPAESAHENGQETPGLHPPPPGLSPLQPQSLPEGDPADSGHNNGQETPGLQVPPPGLSLGVPDGPQPLGSQTVMPDVPDSSVESSPCSLLESVLEPEQEQVPSSRRTSVAVDSVTPSLHQALRRSPDALDGIPNSRNRSRSPPRASQAMIGVAEGGSPRHGLHGFLARRVNKKSAAARMKELNFTKAIGEEREGILAARQGEWGNWQGFDAVDVILPENVQETLDANPGAEITPTRWVDINKAQPWEKPRYKSRIVVRGDLEQGAATRTDSPTCSSTMLGMLLSFTANKKHRLKGGDITASFLQGENLTRTLLLRPPPGGLPGVPEGSLLRAIKPVYGTRDAPRGFFKRLNNVAVRQGLLPVPNEHAAYVLRDDDGIQGMMVSHVDDLLWSGTEKMDAVMKAITEEFKFGTLEVGDSFGYCGRVISQEKEGIRVTCPHHAAKVRPIYLDYQRRKQRDSAVTEHERDQLRSVVGSLNWMVRVCRMDIAYEVNYFQAVMKQATVGDLVACNNLLSYVKKTPDLGLFYKYQAFNEEDMAIYSITDASHAADFELSASGVPMGNRSQSGRILALGPKSLATTGKGTIHVIEYHSNVLKRVCRSTLQAEALSLITGYEESEHVRTLWAHLKGVHVDKNLIASMDYLDIFMLTDCKSLEQHLLQAGLHTVTDKRLAIDISAMRQVVWRRKGELVGDPLLTDEPPPEATTKVLWIDTSTMLSDGLTKKMKSSQLELAMKCGNLELSFEKIAPKGLMPKEK
ncbi:RE1 [Symbiodinium sp. CCMP2592]|nr:RE1 [Symbiodinium sp. CCMP2592]